MIERIDKDGGIAGTACEAWPSGQIAGDRMREDERSPYEGWDLSTWIGTTRVTYTPWYEGKIRRLTGRTEADGSLGGGGYTVMKRTKRLLCAHLFASEPQELPALREDTGDTFIGYWEGIRSNGLRVELRVEHITAKGEVLGRMCGRGTRKILVMFDLYPGGPVKSRYDPEQKEIEAVAQTIKEGRVIRRYRLVGDRSISLTTTTQAGTDNEQERFMRLWRGANPEGCLAMTYTNGPWKGRGDAGATHPRLGGLGQRVPPPRQKGAVRQGEEHAGR